MNLREFVRNLIMRPFESEDLSESREQREANDRRQREIARRLQLLGIEVDVMRHNGHDREC